MLLALATPAYPQTASEDLAADEDGNLVGPRSPDYRVDENGLIIGGRGQIRTCQAAGFDTAGDLPASASSPPGASEDGDGTLPETGGPAFPTPLLPAATLLLSAGGLLTLRETRRPRGALRRPVAYRTAILWPRARRKGRGSTPRPRSWSLKADS